MGIGHGSTLNRGNVTTSRENPGRPYSRPMPMVVLGAGAFSSERGTPVHILDARVKPTLKKRPRPASSGKGDLQGYLAHKKTPTHFGPP